MTPHDPRLDALLSDDRYHIEFNGFLTNHVKHAVIALAGLGASAERVVDYHAAYAQRTPYGVGLEPARPAERALDEGSWLELLGRRTDFAALLRFFAAREHALGTDGLLRRYAPQLLPGCAGALLHGTIHTGWALDAGHRGMLVEGLAYMAFAWVSSFPERGGASGRAASVWESLLELADAWEDGDLRAWRAATLAADELDPRRGFHPEIGRTGAQLTVAKVLARSHPLLDTTPAWVQRPTAETWPQLHEAAALLYLTEPGDFVLLHVITALHALEQIARRLPEAQQVLALRCGWKAILGVLIARGRLPTRARLASLETRYRDAVDAELEPAPDEAQAWPQIVARALAAAEEHNPKLVYVQRLLWERSGRKTLYRIAASHFTTTPEVRRMRTASVEVSPQVLRQGACVR